MIYLHFVLAPSKGGQKELSQVKIAGYVGGAAVLLIIATVCIVVFVKVCVV